MTDRLSELVVSHKARGLGGEQATTIKLNAILHIPVKSNPLSNSDYSLIVIVVIVLCICLIMF